MTETETEAGTEADLLIVRAAESMDRGIFHRHVVVRHQGIPNVTRGDHELDHELRWELLDHDHAEPED